MQCEDARQLLLDTRYGGAEVGPEASEHVARCEACRAYAADAERLDSVLARDQNEEPRPGFDTRFFARLEEAKQPRRRFTWRWLVAASATAAAAGVLWLISTDRTPPMAQDLELAMNLEMLEQYELVRSLDDVEAFELFGEVDPTMLVQLIAEEGEP